MSQHWLDEMVKKYGNDHNNGKDPTSVDKWEYGNPGDGRDTDLQMKNSKYFGEVPIQRSVYV